MHITKLITTTAMVVSLCSFSQAAPQFLHLTATVVTKAPTYRTSFTNNDTPVFYYGDLKTQQRFESNQPYNFNTGDKFGFFVLQAKFNITHQVNIQIGNKGKECDFNFYPKGPGEPGMQILSLNNASCRYSFTNGTETFTIN